MTNRWGKSGKKWQILISWAPKSLWMVTAAMKLRHLLLERKAMTDIVLKSRDHFANKGLYSQNYGFSSSHVRMWELDHKEGWASKNWCFWTVVLEKTLESPLDCKESTQFILEEIIPEYSLEGLLLKLKLQYFGHLMWRADSLEKTLMLGNIEGRRRRGRQMMRWLDGITDSMNMSFEQTLRDSEGQGILACHSPWGCKESDMT